MMLLRREHIGCPWDLSKKDLQRYPNVGACRGGLLRNLQQGFPGFSGTQGNDGRKEKELNVGTDSSKIPFLSPLPSEILDGILPEQPWSQLDLNLGSVAF